MTNTFLEEEILLTQIIRENKQILNDLIDKQEASAVIPISKKRNKNNKGTAIYLDNELTIRIDMIAKRTKKSRSAVVNEALLQIINYL